MNALCGTLLLWQRLWRRLRIVRLVMVFAVLGVVSTVAMTWAMAWWATSDPRRLSLTKDEEIACATVTVKSLCDVTPASDFDVFIPRIATCTVQASFGWPWRTMDFVLSTSDYARPIGMIYAGYGSSHAASMNYQIGQPGTSVAGMSMATVCLPLRPIPAGFVAFSLIMSAAWFVLWLCMRRSLGGRSSARGGEDGSLLALVFVLCRVGRYAMAGFALSVACAWWMGWNREIDTDKLPPAATSVVNSEDLDLAARRFLYSGTWTGPVVPVWHEVDRARWSGIGYAVTRMKPGERTMMSDGQFVAGRASADFPEWMVCTFGLPLPAMTWEYSRTNSVLTAFGGTVSEEMAEGFRGGMLICLPGDLRPVPFWEHAMRNRLPLAIEPVPMAFNVAFWGGGLWLIVGGSRRLVDRHLARVGVCRDCGYDARGLARCPECGGEMNAQPVADQAAVGSLAGRG